MRGIMIVFGTRDRHAATVQSLSAQAICKSSAHHVSGLPATDSEMLSEVRLENGNAAAESRI